MTPKTTKEAVDSAIKNLQQSINVTGTPVTDAVDGKAKKIMSTLAPISLTKLIENVQYNSTGLSILPGGIMYGKYYYTAAYRFVTNANQNIFGLFRVDTDTWNYTFTQCSNITCTNGYINRWQDSAVVRMIDDSNGSIKMLHMPAASQTGSKADVYYDFERNAFCNVNDLGTGNMFYRASSHWGYMYYANNAYTIYRASLGSTSFSRLTAISANLYVCSVGTCLYFVRGNGSTELTIIAYDVNSMSETTICYVHSNVNLVLSLFYKEAKELYFLVSYSGNTLYKKLLKVNLSDTGASVTIQTGTSSDWFTDVQYIGFNNQVGRYGRVGDDVYVIETTNGGNVGYANLFSYTANLKTLLLTQLNLVIHEIPDGKMSVVIDTPMSYNPPTYSDPNARFLYYNGWVYDIIRHEIHAADTYKGTLAAGNISVTLSSPVQMLGTNPSNKIRFTEQNTYTSWSRIWTFGYQNSGETVGEVIDYNKNVSPTSYEIGLGTTVSPLLLQRFETEESLNELRDIINTI